MTDRIFNFSSGPAVLPLPVLEQVQRDLVALPGVGMSVMEISHRSAAFEAIIGQAEADIRRLADIPDHRPRSLPLPSMAQSRTRGPTASSATRSTTG